MSVMFIFLAGIMCFYFVYKYGSNSVIKLHPPFIISECIDPVTVYTML